MLILQPEPIPTMLQKENVRTKLNNIDTWNKIRLYVFNYFSGKCCICNTIVSFHGDNVFHCHELWEYEMIDETNLCGIQRLKGFQCLCELCHSVKHIGFIEKQHPDRYMNSLNHMMRVNNINMTKAINVISKTKNGSRNLVHWIQNTDILDGLKQIIDGG